MTDILADLSPEAQRHRVLLADQAATFCGYEVSSWRKMYRKGEVPPPIELSARRYGWKLGTLIDWIDAKAAASKNGGS